eukprot:TRINITY_DN3560_c1_g1_i1.p1 TRINITY_DN3560_c1_g1~~TRINITY_DN3560_c1_g1_i1.p1  ORF type:complete len:954 (+),score=184.32 TRINITY_DN3560_c1_g1_i1:150-3011(+)
MTILLQSAFEALAAVKLELFIFVLAFCTHFILFGNKFKRFKQSGEKAQNIDSACPDRTKNSNPSRELAETLLRELRPLLRSDEKSSVLSQRLHAVLANQKLPQSLSSLVLARVLEGFRSPTKELLDAIRPFLKPDAGMAKLAEQLLRGYMDLRLRGEFCKLLAEVEQHTHASGEQLPPALTLLALQSALGDHDLQAALKRLADAAPAWGSLIELGNRGQLLQQLSSLASEQKSTPAMLATIKNCGLFKAAPVEHIFMGAARHGDCEAIMNTMELAQESQVVLTPVSHCAILLGLAGCGSDEDVLKHYEANLADVNVLAVLTKAGRAVAAAAMRQGRRDVLASLLRDCEDSRIVGLLKSFGVESRLDEARQIFEACPVKSALLHNALVDAIVRCGDSKALEMAVDEARCAGLADVVTYNTVIKGHLQRGDVKHAKKVLEAMRYSGLKPNVVTFNELLDASAQRDACWALIDEMRACDLKPNKVTCSIVLKNLKSSSSSSEVERTMALLDSIDDMDEVLLSSVCEACIRTGRANLLAKELRKQRGPKAVKVHGAHTFGSLIRAHGFIHDLQGVWATWRDMKEQHVLPTSITMGCMVESLVTNDDMEAAYDLVQEVAADERTKPLVNAVIYGSLLKGFCHQKKFTRVWTIYEEMLARGMTFSIVTFNSLIDACARSGEMHRVKSLLDAMSEQAIAPNVITYSTVIKGYCSANRLDEAFELLEDMKLNKHICPDEVTYNTLLDGCARYGLFDRGLSVLEDMRGSGVPPSNFTLSVVVKLATRAKKPAKAFELCDQISQEFGLRPNVHVFNNLIQAAAATVSRRGQVGSTLRPDSQPPLETVERMFRAKVRPDPRTYTLLLRWCLDAEQPDVAVQLLRSAAGLCGGHPRLSAFPGVAPLRQGIADLPQDFIAEVLDFAVANGSSPQVVLLVQELSKMPGAKLSLSFCQRYASRAIKQH